MNGELHPNFLHVLHGDYNLNYTITMAGTPHEINMIMDCLSTKSSIREHLSIKSACFPNA